MNHALIGRHLVVSHIEMQLRLAPREKLLLDPTSLLFDKTLHPLVLGWGAFQSELGAKCGASLTKGGQQEPCRCCKAE